jgi:ribosomal protein S18 acetylase RimI-like enzyme
MIVRRATLEDARAIATIHVHAWQVAYQAILPSALLDSLSIEERESMWRQNLERRRSETWVAEDNDHILGWVSAARSRDRDAAATTGEVWAIYVDPPHWRRGVGQRLWREAEEYLGAAGFADVTLWVLKGNAGAIAFYRSIGLAIESGSEKTISEAGAELVEVRLRKRFGS